MILRDCKWVVADPGPPEDTPRRKKRRVTPAMKRANKSNAQASTGPKSAQGKQTASLNGVTHGQTCTKLIFLPGESTEKFDSDVAVWSRRLGARTEPEIAQVKTAVYSLLKAERADKAEVSAVNETIDNINDFFDVQKQEEVQKLILDLPAKPKETHARLMSSTAGIACLINKFTYFQSHFKSYTSFQVSDRAIALRIGGHDPKDLFHDPIVWWINQADFGALFGPGGYSAEEAANALQEDCPDGMTYAELVARLEPMMNDLPTIEEGHLYLKKYVQDWIDKLTERKELIQLREDRDRANAIGKAELDGSAEGDKRKRHANASTRLSHSAIRLLFTMQHERRKYGEGDLSDPSPQEGPAVEAAPVESETLPVTEPESHREEPPTVAATVVEGPDPVHSPAVENQEQSEAVTTQVVGGTGGNNATSAHPAVGHGNPVELTEEKIAAARAIYRRMNARVEAQLKECLDSEHPGAVPDS